MSCTADNVISIGTQLFTEAVDMDVDGAVGNNNTCPNGIHELLAGEHMFLFCFDLGCKCMVKNLYQSQKCGYVSVTICFASLFSLPLQPLKKNTTL